MRCPTCRGGRSKVINSRLNKNEQRLRRHECLNNKCKHRFSTIEVAIFHSHASIKKELTVEYRRQIIATVKDSLFTSIHNALTNLSKQE